MSGSYVYAVHWTEPIKLAITTADVWGGLHCENRDFDFGNRYKIA